MNSIKIFNVIAVIACAGAYFNSAQGIAHYRAVPLNFINKAHISENEMSFEYKIFNPKDCRRFLGRPQIIRKGYTPIQISITNNTDQMLIMSLDNISLPATPYYTIAELVKFHTSKRVVAWGIPGLFIWPFLIPAIMEAIESPRANENLIADYANKALTNGMIKPFSTLNGIIFVPNSQVNSFFSITLIGSGNNEKYALTTEAKNVIV